MHPIEKPDYERLYHQLNRRRGKELKELEASCQALVRAYAALLQRERQLRSLSRECAMFAMAMANLDRLKASFLETDQIAEEIAMEEPPEDRKKTEKDDY